MGHYDGYAGDHEEVIKSQTRNLKKLNKIYHITVEECDGHDSVIYSEFFEADSIQKVKDKAQRIINKYILDEYYNLKDAKADGVNYEATWEEFYPQSTSQKAIAYYCEHLASHIIIRQVKPRKLK